MTSKRIFRVTYRQYQSELGEIKVEATSISAAEKQVKQMAKDCELPLKEGFSFDGVLRVE